MLKIIENIFNSIFSKPEKKETQIFDLPKYFLIAEKEIGVKEIAGNKHNPRILEYHQATQLKATADEVSWCAAFVNWCLKQSGELGTLRADARSFLGWGIETKTPRKGDIVVFWRGKKSGWQGHVAFFIEENSDAVKVLGGNQNNKVCYMWYPKSQVLGYRRLA